MTAGSAPSVLTLTLASETRLDAFGDGASAMKPLSLKFSTGLVLASTAE